MFFAFLLVSNQTYILYQNRYLQPIFCRLNYCENEQICQIYVEGRKKSNFLRQKIIIQYKYRYSRKIEKCAIFTKNNNFDFFLHPLYFFLNCFNDFLNETYSKKLFDSQAVSSFLGGDQPYSEG